MKLLLDTCVWGGAKKILESSGHDVVWSGDWPEDPGDEEILAKANNDNQICLSPLPHALRFALCALLFAKIFHSSHSIHLSGLTFIPSLSVRLLTFRLSLIHCSRFDPKLAGLELFAARLRPSACVCGYLTPDLRPLFS